MEGEAMMHLNLLDTGGRLARLDAACERITENAGRPELRAAVVSMYREQGFSDCDHCGRLATFAWERTAAEIKRIQGKGKRRPFKVLPVSWRCVVHVPHAFPELGENYRDARVVREAAAVAAVA
jgi:hypothetical protein